KLYFIRPSSDGDVTPPTLHVAGQSVHRGLIEEEPEFYQGQPSYGGAL
ncbi:MAG: hypothetical protein ACI9HK_004877, partial [Pirellulaceae bacterium]